MISTLGKIQQRLMSSGDLKTPLYIADKSDFKRNITDFIAAFRKYYPNYNIGYSLKTNYCEDFINVVKEVGGYAEVVSPTEYQMARNYGFDYSQIIYNGVIPDLDDKLRCANHGGIVNVDNVGELGSLFGISTSPLAIGVRLNFDIGNGVVSRFGIDVDSKDYKEIIELQRRGLIRIKCIHCHISYARGLSYFKKRAEMMATYAKELGANIVDIGGNMFGRMDGSLKVQYGEYVPSYEEYAKVIGEVFAREFPNGEVLLITESGTPIVSTSMSLLATIIGKKVIKGKTMLVVDCKRDDVGFVCHTKNPPCAVLADSGDYVEHATIYGCTCIENDIIHRDYSGYANIGDRIAISNVGAYGCNVANDFIMPKPGCVCVDDTQAVKPCLTR